MGKILALSLLLLVPSEDPAEAAAPSAACVYSSTNGISLGEKGLAEAARTNSILYAGETHDSEADHAAQLSLLMAAYQIHGQSAAAGFEMLNYTLQPVLNDFAEGRISEEEFLNRTDWEKEWGFDYALYRPIFNFIREKGLKALALNLPRAITAKIARAGLAGLNTEEREMLPADFRVTEHSGYLSYLRESFGGHGSHGFSFENYAAAMSAWNETMGEKLAAHLKNRPDARVVVLAGNGHIIYNAGIPASAASRIPGLRQASFFTRSQTPCLPPPAAEKIPSGDYIWHTGD